MDIQNTVIALWCVLMSNSHRKLIGNSDASFLASDLIIKNVTPDSIEYQRKFEKTIKNGTRFFWRNTELTVNINGRTYTLIHLTTDIPPQRSNSMVESFKILRLLNADIDACIMDLSEPKHTLSTLAKEVHGTCPKVTCREAIAKVMTILMPRGNIFTFLAANKQTKLEGGGGAYIPVYVLNGMVFDPVKFNTVLYVQDYVEHLLAEYGSVRLCPYSHRLSEEQENFIIMQLGAARYETLQSCCGVATDIWRQLS